MSFCGKLFFCAIQNLNLQIQQKKPTKMEPMEKTQQTPIGYALHILNNKHVYGAISNAMTLLKHINKTSLLLPYEQLYVQSYHQHKQLISEQCIGEHNAIYQLIHNTFVTPHETNRSIPHHQHN
jgi:hypothetical protein